MYSKYFFSSFQNQGHENNVALANDIFKLTSALMHCALILDCVAASDRPVIRVKEEKGTSRGLKVQGNLTLPSVVVIGSDGLN